MEIIIGLLVVAGVAWFFFMRNDKTTEVAAPYKVEASAPIEEPVKVEDPKVEALPAETKVSSIVAPAKKAPAKPKAAAKPKTPAKTAAKAPVKTTKAPAKPKVTVAK